MKQAITARLPSELLDSPNVDQMKRELEDVQEYLDDIDIDLEDSAINFLFLRGHYSHINRETTIMGLFINTLPHSALAFRGIVTLQHVEADEDSAQIEVSFPNSFIGEFLPDEGILVYLSIPTEGLVSDTTFKTTEIFSSFSDVEYIAIKPEGDDSDSETTAE